MTAALGVRYRLVLHQGGRARLLYFERIDDAEVVTEAAGAQPRQLSSASARHASAVLPGRQMVAVAGAGAD